MAIRIITDSSCDLPKEIVSDLGVKIVPLSVSFGAETFREGIDIGPDEFYRRMAGYPGLPKTSQPAPADFQNTIDEVIQLGDEPLVLTITSALSGTYNSACIAAEPYGEKVTVIDSHNGTLGLGLLVMRAVEMIKQGLPRQAIIEHIHRLRERIHTIVLLNTTENVVKGGRLPRIAGTVASVLDLKPIIAKIPGGFIKQIGAVRGRKQSFRHAVELMRAEPRLWPETRVGITHSNCLDDALMLKGMIVEALSPLDTIVAYMGSSIGTYAGIGGITVSF